MIAALLTTSATDRTVEGVDPWLAGWAFGLTTGGYLVVPVLLMILVRGKYPLWWFDWNLELARFEGRIYAYLALLRDEYPSTDEPQAVHLEIDYPDAARDLRVPGRRAPLGATCARVRVSADDRPLPAVQSRPVNGGVRDEYPSTDEPQAVHLERVAFTHGRSTTPTRHWIFGFLVGVLRWALRVHAYVFLLTTDRYPPFSLDL